MKEIPGRLQCAYCERNYRHGGECHRPSVKESEGGCLAFKADPKGCIREADLRLAYPLYYDIPPLNTWDDNWTINDRETAVAITRVKGIKWDKRQGQLILYCECRYYVNDFSENQTEPQPNEKPKLKRVK